MTVWIDITNSPQVLFFRQMIHAIEERTDVLVTCRPLGNTVDLLEMFDIPHHVVGGHYGANKVRKAFGFGVRVRQLYDFLKKQRVSVALSHSSFYSPITAKALGCPSIYLNDNEHAIGNLLSFLFATEAYIPQHLGEHARKKHWNRLTAIRTYPGVKEAIYLSSVIAPQDPEKRSKSGSDCPRVYVRPAPWTAQYFNGDIHALDGLVAELGKSVSVVVLPRDAKQAKHYHELVSDLGRRTIEVAAGTEELDNIVANCDLFIGAGGTMTRELAVMGVPTISVYHDKLLEVDRFLLRQNKLIHCPGLTARSALRYMEECSRQMPDVELLDQGRLAFALILEGVMKYVPSFDSTKLSSNISMKDNHTDVVASSNRA